MQLLLNADQLEAHADTVGRKALNLARLTRLGCRIPPFVVIPSTQVAVLNDDEHLARIADEAAARVPARAYAVRSAALIEDDAERSFAGQFLTRINVDADGLAQAILEVAHQARASFDEDLAECSVIIQEYVPADIAGVAFTRHPAGQRQMIIEYHQGIGETLVSGKVNPEALEYYWTEKIPQNDMLPLGEIIPAFKAIETSFGGPQDIEWCLAEGRLHILQARPITSISKEVYQKILFLDQTLPNGRPFLFEQTAISEIAPRPTPFTFSVLKRLYADGGPISRVYQKYGVKYEPRDFLRIVGNQLYVDREEELRTLLPAYSRLQNPSSARPTIATTKGLWKSWKNKNILAGIRVRNLPRLIEASDLALSNIPQRGTLSDIWRAFDDCYALIFEINLLAEISIRRLDAILKPYHQTAVRILSSAFRKKFFDIGRKTPPNGWIGNGLEIGDEDAFVARTPSYGKNEALDAWWNALPDWRKTYLQPFIEHAVTCDALRERGRWITVGYVNAMRRTIGNDAFFSTIDELERGKRSSEKESERKRTRDETAVWSFPPRLTNLTDFAQHQGPQGISFGIAEGVLISRERLEQTGAESRILGVDVLTPDLAQYFDRIKGIVSVHGGALSHLAILAREQRIPVVTNVDFKKEDIRFGDRLRIDGDSGVLTVLK